MEQQYLQVIEKVLPIIQFIFFVVISLILTFKTGDTKYLKEVLKKMEENDKKTNAEGQVFPRFKPVYRLNKSTNILEKTDEVIDISEVVQSDLETTLTKVLERFMPYIQPQTTVSDDVAQLDDMRDDLDRLQDLAIFTEELKSKYDIDEFADISQVLTAINEKKIAVENHIKEVKESEVQKKIIEKSEQA